MHPNTVEFKVTGDFALFTDPTTKVGGEKCSYQVPTYEALKGIISSVYWKPTIIWYIDEVRVMNQIRMFSQGIRPTHYQNDKNDLSYYTYLEDCCYQVRAHFEWNKNRPELEEDRITEKHLTMAKYAIRKGGRRDIFLGTRECQAFVEPCVFGEGKGYYDDLPAKDFGIMVHGITYPDEAYSEATRGMMTVRLWDQVMKNGVIKFLRPEDCTISKPIRPMRMKIFDKKHQNFTPVEEEEMP